MSEHRVDDGGACNIPLAMQHMSDTAKAAMAQYLTLCESVLTPDDYQEFTEKKKVDGKWVQTTKRFKKKSAVKKLQTYFGISVDVIRSTIVQPRASQYRRKALSCVSAFWSDFETRA